VTSIFHRFAIALALATAIGTVAVAQKPSPFQEVQPDNTKKNKSGGTVADQQGQSQPDLDMTKKIRDAVTSDSTLSMLAQNVKIITNNGTVTLRGPVNTAAEKTAIYNKAVDAAGKANVKNQIQVKPAKDNQ